MNHSTNIVLGERGELFLHEKALRAYFCAGFHIILARIVASKQDLSGIVTAVALIGRLLRPDIVQFHFACLGTEIFLRELTLSSTLS